LLVDSDGIVALGVHAVVVEVLQQCIALLGSLGLDDVEVVDVPVAGLLVRQRDVARLGQAAE
jgi:hypothetical protein